MAKPFFLSPCCAIKVNTTVQSMVLIMAFFPLFQLSVIRIWLSVSQPARVVVVEYVSWRAQCRNKHENLLILSLLLAYFELLCPLNNNCFVFHSIQYTPNRWIFHRTIHIRISYIGIKGFYHRFSNSQNNHMFGHMSAIRYFCFTNTSLFV